MVVVAAKEGKRALDIQLTNSQFLFDRSSRATKTLVPRVTHANNNLYNP